MRYFGVPTCPYCKKRVNLIRTWSLKRQGEYQCPRCGGISNIFLSPLIYVFALLAIFAGGAMYFFHKFILDDISLSIVIQVFVPFAVFFLLSLFMVYLAKPVIKKIPKAELKKKRRKSENFEDRRDPSRQMEPMFYDSDEYLPQTEYQTGPMPSLEERPTVRYSSERENRADFDEMGKTSVVEVPGRKPQRTAPAPSRASSLPQQGPPAAPARPAAPVQRPVQRSRAASQPVRTASAPAPSAQVRQVVRPNAVQESAPHAVTSVDIPKGSVSGGTGDFFAKYDDPAYVERRLRELNEKRGGQE